MPSCGGRDVNASGSSGGCLRSNVMWKSSKSMCSYGAVAGKPHHNIDDDANVPQVASLEETAQVSVGSRPGVMLSLAQLVIRRNLRRAVSPLSIQRAVGGREQFDGVDSSSRMCARPDWLAASSSKLAPSASGPPSLRCRGTSQFRARRRRRAASASMP